MKRLRVDVSLLEKQRMLLEQVLDAKEPNSALNLVVNKSELLEGLENMLSDIKDRLLNTGEVLLYSVRRRTGGAS